MIRQLQIFVLIALVSCGLSAETQRHGEIRIAEKTEAWDEDMNEWLTLEQFWGNYTLSKGGLSWDVAAEYPPYSNVKEDDTFMIKLKSGMCLMEFRHTRWRRANDVHRWDPGFNDYASCPDVFK